MTYESSHARRTALEHRLLTASRETGIALDRLRRRVLFERIVARLQVGEPGLWVLRGGKAYRAHSHGTVSMVGAEDLVARIEARGGRDDRRRSRGIDDERESLFVVVQEFGNVRSRFGDEGT